MSLSFEGQLLGSQRPRRYVGPAALALVRPLFRHSASRDAYVLRVVGDRFGPVLRRDRRERRRPTGQLIAE